MNRTSPTPGHRLLRLARSTGGPPATGSSDDYCWDNEIPDCPALTDAYFAEHTVVAVAIDTVTPRPCEGTLDPEWRLDCVTTTDASADVRVIAQRPGSGWCLCSAMPQRLQRLFLAAGVPKTRAKGCRTCAEPHTIDCLR